MLFTSTKEQRVNQRSHVSLILRFITVFWVSTQTDWDVWDVLMLINTSDISNYPFLQLYIPPPSESFCSCLFKSLPNAQPPLIGQLTHAWDGTAHNNRAAVLTHFLSANLSKCVTWWYSVMSQSHRKRGGTTDEAFQEQCFPWERRASADEGFFNVQEICTYKRTLKERTTNEKA